MDQERIIIDLLKDDDNQAILDLSHRCPQDGVIKGYPDRSPHFQRILYSIQYHFLAVL